MSATIGRLSLQLRQQQKLLEYDHLVEHCAAYKEHMGEWCYTEFLRRLEAYILYEEFLLLAGNDLYD